MASSSFLCMLLVLVGAGYVCSNALNLNLSSTSLPSSVDWRKYGAVGRVRDHRSYCCSSGSSCSGGSWAYATASVVESITKIIRGGKLLDLSARQLLDCDKNNFNCTFGYPYDALTYVLSNGLKTACDYAKDMTCSKGTVTIDGRDQLPQEGSDPSKKVNAIMALVAKYPVTAQIDGTNAAFKSYTRGIYTGPCDSFGADLSVVIVGYGSEGGKDYWIIRNSWGTKWGEGGYMRLERGYSNFGGRCGIRGSIAYPILSAAAAAATS